MIDIKEQDRIREVCRKCSGPGFIYQVEREPTPAVIKAPRPISRIETTPIKTVRLTCPGCDGKGYTVPKDGDVVDVYQDGEMVCRCTVPARFRPNPLVDKRPGDFKPKLRDGRMFYEANRNLGPSDLEMLEGWRPPRSRSETREGS